MLPKIRHEYEPYKIPKLEIDTDDFDDFLDELKVYHDQFQGCFSRIEPRENFFEYMVGQFSNLERKSIEPIALKTSSRSVRAMQRTVSELRWDEDKMLDTYHGLLCDDLAEPDGVLIFDETGFVKKGKNSAGVKRQYCSPLGKVENCQIGVFAAYASTNGYAFLDARLYIPKEWFSNAYKEKRAKCQIPDSLSFKTKPQLAAEMFHQIEEKGQIPFKYIVADTVYGDNREFIEFLDNAVGKTFFLAISKDTQIWLRNPLTEEHPYKGEKRSKKVLQAEEKRPITVETFAKELNTFFWYRRKVSEGSQGPIEYEFTRRKIVLAKDGLPWRSFMLIIRRSIGDTPVYSYFISNASESARLPLFVWLSGIRWAIEQCFEEAKSELGMAHYEVRKYPAWKHHMLTSMLAHFFLWHLMIRLGKKKSCYYVAPDENVAEYCFTNERI
jgi:SRSO17 transposase